MCTCVGRQTGPALNLFLKFPFSSSQGVFLRPFRELVPLYHPALGIPVSCDHCLEGLAYASATAQFRFRKEALHLFDDAPRSYITTIHNAPLLQVPHLLSPSSPAMSDEKSIEQEERNEHMLAADLVSNVNARIQNPLHGIPQATLLRQVEEFAAEKGFEEHVDTFKKGALIAQHPGDFESLPLLDEADRAVIRREKTRK